MRRRGPRPTYANVVSTLCLFLFLGGGAVAATGLIGRGGAINGCVDPAGRLTVIKPGTHCKRGQTALVWNQRGPAGAVGNTGPAGPAGPKGDAGTPGTNGVGVGGSCPAGSAIRSVDNQGAVTCEDNPLKLAGHGLADFQRTCGTGYYFDGVLCWEVSDTSGLSWASGAAHCAAAGGRLPTLAEFASLLARGLGGNLGNGGIISDWASDPDTASASFYVNSTSDSNNLSASRANTTTSFARCVKDPLDSLPLH